MDNNEEIIEIPKIKENPNFNELINLVEGIKKEIIDGNYHEDNDNAHYIEEAVYKTLYGDKWFEWYNEQV